jgi:Protein of unknown function (Hypoth_ymh)
MAQIPCFPRTVREKGEQVGLMELFSGAIGFCKNPASHRSPGFERLEAAQLLAFASYFCESASNRDPRGHQSK